jgi:dihydroorotase-like cyclic amidohydrolase
MAEGIPAGATQFKSCRPIREAGNRELLWSGFAEGTIDCIVSDHSPCTAEALGAAAISRVFAEVMTGGIPAKYQVSADVTASRAPMVSATNHNRLESDLKCCRANW